MLRSFIENSSLALQALWNHKLRSLLTTVGVVIGVVTVVGIISIIQGLNSGVVDQISSLGSDVLYIDRFPWVMQGDEWWERRGRPLITLDQYDYVREHATLASQVVPLVQTGSGVSRGEHSLTSVSVTGTSENGLTVGFGPSELAEGRFLSSLEVDRRRMVAVIGYQVAQTLFPNSNPLGERINIGNNRFLVIGVLEEQGSFLGDEMDYEVYIPYGAFIKAFGGNRSYQIAVKVADPSDMESARIELVGLMRTARQLRPSEGANFDINDQEMLMNVYNNLTSGLWAAAIGIGGISLLVGGIGIMNIMLVSVTERTREIGIRKAMGATRGKIMIQFLVESMAVCSLGVLIGLGATAGIAMAVDRLTPLPASISPSWAIMGMGFVLVIGVFFGLWPASRAAKLNPIDALRYE